MSSQPTPSQKKSGKRKSTAAEAPQVESNVKVILTEPSSSAGPTFVNFPSIRPSKDTAFKLYSRDPSSSLDITKQHTLLAGETNDIEFFSTNRDIQGSTEGNDCYYVPAVYDPDAGTVTINQSTPLYLLAHRVKRLKTSATAPVASKTDYRAKRNDLGEAFGTKKAKSQIKAEERNKVDLGAMQSIKGHLMESIGEATEAVTVVEPSELIPRPNVETADAFAVYPRESLIADAEWSAIDAKSLISAKDDRERAGLLPWRRSRFAEEKMRIVIASGMSSTAKKNTVRMAYYLTALLAFNDLGPRLAKLSQSELSAKLPGAPTQLINGLVSRFTENLDKKMAFTEKMRTKLLAWICVVYLHLDEFNVDMGRTAKDLNLPPTKIADMFKNLGCKTDIMGPGDREKAGLSLPEAKNHRRAILKAPVVFPKQKTRGPTR